MKPTWELIHVYSQETAGKKMITFKNNVLHVRYGIDMATNYKIY